MKNVSLESKDIEKVDNLILDSHYRFLTLFRVNYKGSRLYIQQDPFRHFSGLTGALDKVTFRGNEDAKRLDTWKRKFVGSYGEANMNNYVNMTADMGTLVHESLVEIKNNKKIIWSEQADKAEARFEAQFLEMFGKVNRSLMSDMVYDFQKQVASVMQFIHERVSDIYAIEVPAIWDEFSIATPIDLVCECRPTPQGDFKKTTINLKTSDQIGEHQLDQAACELAMWNSTYNGEGKLPSLQCENTAILRTKDWREDKVPTFEFKYMNEQDAAMRSDYAAARLKLALRSGKDSYLMSPVHKAFIGETRVGEAPAVKISSLQEEWQLIPDGDEK